MRAPVLSDNFSGFFLAGAFVRVEPVLYGQKPGNESRAGLPVPGVWRVVVRTALGWEREATYFESEGGHPSQVHLFLGDGSGLIGRQLVIQVKLRPDRKFVNATAIHVRFADEVAA